MITIIVICIIVIIIIILLLIIIIIILAEVLQARVVSWPEPGESVYGGLGKGQMGSELMGSLYLFKMFFDSQFLGTPFSLLLPSQKASWALAMALAPAGARSPESDSTM